MNVLLKLILRPALALGLILVVGSASAGELWVTTFLDDRPIRGLEVQMNGQTIGSTGELGEYRGEIDSGTHQLRLSKANLVLATYEFQLGQGDSADIQARFVDFSTAPVIQFAAYDADDPASLPGAIGYLRGTVVDLAGDAIAGARVRTSGGIEEAYSDEFGQFELELRRGEYSLRVTHPDYRNLTQGGIRVVANIGVAARIVMTPGSEGGQSAGRDPDRVVEEIVVLGTYKPATLAADVEKASIAIVDAISLEELLRFGDSDVAATLKRIVGVSVTDGRYAVVRGLDGRYISSTINGLPMPSTDPFRRDVQLDMFPSGILGGIQIQKNFSADLPGETTGGVISMETRSPPDEFEHSVSVSLGMVDGVTGEAMGSYEGGDTDYLGIDDGARELPGALRAASQGGRDFDVCQVSGQTNCVSRGEAAALAALLPNIYEPQTEDAPIAFGLGYSGGTRINFDTSDLSIYGSASYGQDSSSRIDATVDDLRRRSSYTRDTRNIKLNGYLAADLLGDANWKVGSRTIVLRDTEDTVSTESGLNKNEDDTYATAFLEWVERQFVAQQFLGEVGLFDNQHTLDVRLGFSRTSRLAPDRRSYLYRGDTLAISTVERSYFDLAENGIDFAGEYSFMLELGEGIYSDLIFGATVSTRMRDVELARLGVRRGDNPNDPDLTRNVEALLTVENFADDVFRLNARSTRTDSYDAEQDAVALFVSANTDIGEKLTLVTGLRLDDYTIDLNFPNSRNAASSLESSEVLPALALTWRPNGESLQLRAGYSATVSRPNITELAPSRFYDEEGREFIGCPQCTASNIDNLDFRVEYYYGFGNNLSVALFTKSIDNPIEVSIADGSGSATSALTFRNNRGATISGLEFDLGHTLIDLEEHKLKLGANFSLIDSEIDLDDVGQRLEIDPSRELQGQSPFLANLQLSYDHYPSSQKLTFLVNHFDDRIDIVTRNQPSIYEAGRTTVNFNYEKEFTDSSKLRLKLHNLLDAATEFTQGGRVIERYTRGLAISLGYSRNF